MSSWSRNSSPIDWCEENYVWHSSIAEFFNTFSNFIFFPLGFWGLYQIHLLKLPIRFYLPYLMLPIIGLGSIYFHSTLSFAGQLIDELSILWAINFCLMFQFADRCGKKGFFLHLSINQVYLLVIMIGFLLSWLGILMPILNAPFLFIFAILNIHLLRQKQIQISIFSKKYNLIIKTQLILFFFTLFIWVIDRIACYTHIETIGLIVRFLKLHSIFHILIAISGFSGISIGIYLYRPDKRNDFDIEFGFGGLLIHVIQVKQILLY
eukprot:TRINITY_DN5127_c1_g1_i2.p1 TRINITY_DN5127_c1_g1~~TRINITY_DN5127_c1_g1_i2.p1  ORF type:complete len:278 (-),score=49.14 TRINITY_DN5127_c1_g1_i2:96-890(-)